jgi:amino acid transporter
MRFAYFSMALYSILAIFGAAWGANTNEHALMVAGILPGSVGIVGLMIWTFGADAQYHFEMDRVRKAAKRRARVYRRLGKTLPTLNATQAATRSPTFARYMRGRVNNPSA